MAGALEIARRALDELGFFSKALEEAKGAKMKEGSVQQWKNVLQKQGVKPAELNATGFNALPIDQKLSRDDVINYLTENRVRLGEVRSADNSGLDKLRDEIRAAEHEQGQAADIYGWGSPEHQAARTRLQELAGRGSSLGGFGEPRFEEYTLPGGANYRENLLTLPPRVPSKEQQRATAIKYYNEHRGPDTVPFEEKSPAEQRRLIEYFGDADVPQAIYQSHHWSEPNVIAHSRTKDRLGPNGERVLHIDEIQSDWAQKGRDQGFKDPDIDKKVGALNQEWQRFDTEMRKLWAQKTKRQRELEAKVKTDLGLPGDVSDMMPDQSSKYWPARDELVFNDPVLMELNERYADANLERNRRRENIDVLMGRTGNVPPAPFVTETKDWTDLTLKRAMIEAERGGYDAVAWTPGAEHAKRYDLGDQVGDILYYPDSGKLRIYSPDNDVLHDAVVSADQLPGIIGRDNSSRLLSSQVKQGNYYTIRPEDMTWGGDGMKAFYDKIVPDRLTKLARTLDPEARIESMPARISDLQQHEVSPEAWAALTGSDVQLPMLRLTPRMREEIQKGLPLFVGAPVVAGGALSALEQPAPMANEFARGGPVRDEREQRRLQDIERASPSEEMLGDSAYRYYMPGYDRLMANRPIGGTDAYRLPPVRKFEVGGLADRGYEANYGAQAGGGSGGGIDWNSLYDPIPDSFFNDWNNTINTWQGQLAQGIDPSTGNLFSTDAAMASGPGMAGYLGSQLYDLPYSQPMPEVQPYEGASPVAPEAPALADLSGGMLGGGAAYPGAAAETMQPADVQIEAPYDLPAGLPSELTQVATDFPTYMDKPDYALPATDQRRDNLSGVNFDFGFDTPTGAPVVEQPMSYERSAMSTPWGYAGTPQFGEAMSVLGPMGMNTPVPAEVGTVFGQHMARDFDPRNAYAPGMGATTYQDWGMPPEQPPAQEIAAPVDTSMPAGLVGNAASSKSAYTSDLVGPFSPQGVRNMAALNQSEVENIAAGFARDLARQRGISIEEAMPDARAMAYQHVTEVAQNRSASFGPIGFGGQRYNPTIEQVINQRSQFSGIPGTHGDGQYPGRVADLPASPEAIAATERVLGGIAAGRRDFPNALDFMNPEESSRRNMDQWGREFVRDPTTQRVSASTGPAHYVGNVNDRAVPSYETLPPVASAPNSLPTSVAAPRGTGRRADAPNAGIADYVAMALGITPAMAGEPVPEGDLPAPRDPSTIPEIDIWAGEKAIGRSVFGGISDAIRSLTGTVGDPTDPANAARPPADQPFGFTPDVLRQDTMPPTEQGRGFGNAVIAGAPSIADRWAEPMAGRYTELGDLGTQPLTAAAYRDTPVPDLPPATSVASVPQPPDEPQVAKPDAVDPEARERAVAAGPMPNSNRYSVDPLTGRMYDNITGDRILNPTYVSRTIDGIAGVTPLGVVNSPLALAGGLTGYPMSLGQLMALGRPGAPTDAYGAGSPDKNGNYRSYGEGAEPFARASGSGVAMPAPSGGGGGALSTAVAANLPPAGGRDFLGVDEDPRTYGLRAMRRYYGTA